MSKEKQVEALAVHQLNFPGDVIVKPGQKFTADKSYVAELIKDGAAIIPEPVDEEEMRVVNTAASTAAAADAAAAAAFAAAAGAP
jgi:agmatine/peptidylarginine deiminase